MDDKTSKKDQTKKTVASEALEKIAGNKKESRADKLLSLIPEGHSPKVYLNLVKTQVLGVDKDGKDRPDEDLMLFLYTAKRTGLDPLAKQIYAVYRWDTRIGREKMTIQTGIDGMRLIAQRSGDYAGQEDAAFIPVDESSKYPVKATVTVYKVLRGMRVAFTATARWGEYVQLGKDGKTIGLWEKMPYLMLAKCAEALALRKAFPNELSGLYAKEEMPAESSLLTDLPTPEKFKKEETEPVVEHGAPDAEARPAIGSVAAKEVSEELKEESKKEAIENQGTEVHVTSIPSAPTPVARKVEEQIDVVAMRKANKDRKERENGN